MEHLHSKNDFTIVSVCFICLDDVNMRRFIEQAASEDMVGPEYVYLVLSERITAGEYTPWGSRPQNWTNQRWLEYKNLFASIRFVRIICYFFTHEKSKLRL